MNRRKALWLLSATGVLAIAGVLLMRRHRAARDQPIADWATDPGRAPVTTVPASVTTGPTTAPTTASTTAPSMAVPEGPAASAGTPEEPLPVWVRATIVVAALLAFLAVSVIATKNA